MESNLVSILSVLEWKANLVDLIMFLGEISYVYRPRGLGQGQAAQIQSWVTV